MSNELERLQLREKARRDVLWKIKGLWPGNVASREVVALLDVIEQQDQNDPIGPAIGMTIEQLREAVPVTELRGFRIVLDDDVPEPWRTRFSQASVGSTRIKEGFYVQDWLKFLHGWQQEMEHVQNHRAAWQQLDREEERWEIFQQIKDMILGDPKARPLLDRLDEIAAEDLPALKLDQVRESVEYREVGRWMVVPDRNIPRPWNVRFGLYVGRAGRCSEGWFVEDWEDFLDAWKAALERVERHRKEMDDD